MKTIQCSGTVKGPKRGRVYVYDPRPCRRMVQVEDTAPFGFCRDHTPRERGVQK